MKLSWIDTLSTMCLHYCSKICFHTSTKNDMIEEPPLFQSPSSKILRYIQTPPTKEQRLLFGKYRPNNKKRVKCVCGFQSYIVFSNKEVYGPFMPDQASPSDPSMPSRHAEVVAIKYLKSIKRSLKGARLYCIHWNYNIITSLWELADGIPCQDCSNFILKSGITKMGVSSKINNNIIHVDIDYILKKTKPSTGRLYGK